MMDYLMIAGLLFCFAALIRILMGHTAEEKLTAFRLLGTAAAVVALLYSISTMKMLPLLVGLAWLAQVYITAEMIRRMGE